MSERKGKIENIFSISVCISNGEKQLSRGLSALSTKESPFLCKLHLYNEICSPNSLTVCTLICLICRHHRKHKKGSLAVFKIKGNAFFFCYWL